MTSGNGCLENLSSATAKMQQEFMDSWFFWMRSFAMPTPFQWLESHSFISLKPFWEDLVRTEKWRPNDHLDIVAYCMTGHRPIFYRGTDYDLATVGAASGSVRDVFLAVGEGTHRLEDGARYHYNPVDGLREPCIVISPSRVEEMASPWMPWVDQYLQLRELLFPYMPATQKVDTKQHVQVVLRNNLAGLSVIGPSLEDRLLLGMKAYRETIVQLSREIAAGRLVPRPIADCNSEII
jgi:hypothetical protein